MDFKKYQHIERLEKDTVDGILNGTCYIFPKIDGTNGSIWMEWNFDEGYFMSYGSRNRKLSEDKDNQKFLKTLSEYESSISDLIRYIEEGILLNNIPLTDIIIYGEWLVPHTLKTYRKDAWNKFYIFDIRYKKDDEWYYINYEEYKPILEKWKEYNKDVPIDYIPILNKIEDPTQDKLIDIMKKNYYLIEDGNPQGEGIVIKNYDYSNKYGRQVWAKMITNRFLDKHNKENIKKVKPKKKIEKKIVEKYLMENVIDKEIANVLKNRDVEKWDKNYIPELIGRVWHTFIKEETFDFVKKFNNPNINFNTLKSEVIKRLKELRPDYF